ncbi:hypothetical protein HBO38_08810 [Pseudomonas veronii]|uniref:Uncharacterized protein n=1 Tax=Pseudomonas veronii TaxID=76761 RepID=A0A7Y1A3U7_PSEVE|nr:hypothetical protein [Pseudomonas veronii]NMY08546.1 hypothetical protein [Pseudomonas veronii]
MTDKNRQAFEAYFRGCAIANGKDATWISKKLERAEDGTYMRAPAYDGWCYWMAAKDFKAIDPQSKASTSRNLCAYYYSFESTGCDLIDSVLESVANAGSGYHHTEDWREEYDDGSSPLSNMQKAADVAAAEVESLITALNEILRVTPMGVEAFGIAALALGELGVRKEPSNV